MPGMMQPERRIEWDVTETLARVTVKSMFSGQENVRTLNMTKAQYTAWQGGQHIQNAMPHLSPDEREFLLTGTTPEEWDAEFGEGD